MRTLALRYFLGVDLGQRQDHTAMALIEEGVFTEGRRDAVTFEPIVERRKALRHLRRVPLGTGYNAVVEMVRRMAESVELRDQELVVAVDATGVGAPVVESLRSALWNLPQRGAWLSLAPVIFTSGQAGRWKNAEYLAPKNELMARLVMSLERGELQIAKGMRFEKEVRAELLGMRRQMGEGGERWKSAGAHDDLVMALALAVWGAEYRPLPRP